mmetsp:Transcript_41811/g.121159  ORF Transcript_41811/g.121159 Transcript_41811/m.121159 type:complete len:345 (-) Transcript_41811:83-1117(-)
MATRKRKRAAEEITEADAEPALERGEWENGFGGSDATVVYGIDFSGAADAGRKLLIARCILEPQRPRPAPRRQRLPVKAWTLRVCQVLTAGELPGGGLDPETALAALREDLSRAAVRTARANRPLIVGVDSPPSVAARFVRPRCWPKWAAGFRRRFPTPDLFREATSIARSAGNGRSEPKRETDVRHKTPLPPQNLRMYKQTWWAIAGLFAPLATRGFAVVPCADAEPKKPWLMESCPASVLKRLGLYTEAYKGRQTAQERRRAELVALLEQGVEVGSAGGGTVTVILEGPSLRARLVADPGADRLDAVLAAVGAACATRREDFPAPHDGDMLDIYKVEACVYC